MKTTYIPNTIEIPTHEADLKHYGVGFEGRSKNHQWSRREVERECRKKESEEEERERGGGERGIQRIESRRINWRDLSTSRTNLTSVTDMALHYPGQRGDRARASRLSHGS
jgi:hypothetical protein